MTTWLFAGGGTGGHLFPGIALAEELLARDPEGRVVFAGSGRAIECAILAAHGLEHHPLPVEPATTLRRRPLRFLWRSWRAWRAAADLVARERPAAVIGLGGFASVPVVLAASQRRLPTLLLEQNAIPGRATRWLSHVATRVCQTFPDVDHRLPRRAAVRVTGNPVRRGIGALGARPKEETSRPTLLILGGSQGASAVNEAVVAAVERLGPALAGWRIVHQAGALQAEEVRRRYQAHRAQDVPCARCAPARRAEQDGAADPRVVVEPFFHALEDWYSRADLVVSRAGATTLTELACAGLPAILIPYPHAADNHQLANARLFEAAGAARIVVQSPTLAETAAALADVLSPLVAEAAERRAMGGAMRSLARHDAARQVADELALLTGGLGREG